MNLTPAVVYGIVTEHHSRTSRAINSCVSRSIKGVVLDKEKLIGSEMGRISPRTPGIKRSGYVPVGVKDVDWNHVADRDCKRAMIYHSHYVGWLKGKPTSRDWIGKDTMIHSHRTRIHIGNSTLHVYHVTGGTATMREFYPGHALSFVSYTVPSHDVTAVIDNNRAAVRRPSVTVRGYCAETLQRNRFRNRKERSPSKRACG